MSTISKVYCNTVKKQFKVFYANWLPTQPLSLGDYGTLDGNVFQKLGNIKTKFPDLTSQETELTEDQNSDHCYFTSGKAVDVKFYAKGSVSPNGVPIANAKIDVEFSKENAIFFNAAGCKTTSFANKELLGNKLMQKLKEKQWEKKYVVITDVLVSENATISISLSSNSGIGLEASSPALEKINLGDAEIKLNPTWKKNIGYSQESVSGCVVLIGLCGIRSPFLRPDVFEIKSILKGDMNESFQVEELNQLQTSAPEDGKFIQLGVN